MAKPFDVTTKQLVEMRPTDWLAFLNLPGASAEVIDADLSTVTTEADRVLRVAHPQPYLSHIEFTAHVDDLEERTLRYNVLLRYQYKMPVVSVIVVLRSAAETPGSRLTGRLRQRGPDDSLVVEFRYRVVRVWEQETESLLAGGLATLPLAPLTVAAQTDLPAVIRRMSDRIDAEATEQQAREIWSSAYILLGLTYPQSMINNLLRGVRQMRESSTYMAILEEGEVKGEIKGALTEARRMLILLGNRRLGAPSPEVDARLAVIDSREQIEELALRVSDVETWDDLLGD